ncbi:MAG: hypothetical protein WC489_00115 [Patescibacteria group bacterium]
MENILKKSMFVFFLVFLFSVSFTTSNDFSQDLGRHLKLGEIIVENWSIPKTNLFSYTYPSFKFINHHWFSEVLFHLISSFSGLSALIFLKVVLFIFAGYFTVKGALKAGKSTIVFFLSPAFFLLLIDRLNIRPELFGYLFFALLYYVLFFQSNQKLWYTAPFILGLWINTHISFVLGLFLFAVFIMPRLVHRTKRMKLLLLSTIVALCINPHGVVGLLYPFSIFRNYGYTIAENQNIFFMNSYISNMSIRYFFFISPFVLFALLILLIKQKYDLFTVLLVFFMLPFWQVRHLPFFVFASIAPVSYAYTQTIPFVKKMCRQHVGFIKTTFILIFYSVISVCILLFVQDRYHLIFDTQKTFGYGFDESQKEAAEFVISKDLPRNIFNNFDIGGYAIYGLYPAYKVFVDNRPEAYPADFFKNIYIDMQYDENLRTKVFSEYDIHTIFFGHSDGTPWGIQFLSRISQDPKWKMVFLNDTVVVMTDDPDHIDIRNNSDHISKLINKQTRYIPLLHLYSTLSIMGQNDLAMNAFSKAQKINPDSCFIKQTIYKKNRDNPMFFATDDIKQKAWWCF